MPRSWPIAVRRVPRCGPGEVRDVQGVPAEAKAAEEVPALLRHGPQQVQYLLWPGQQDVHNMPGREKAPALQAAGDNLEEQCF